MLATQPTDRLPMGGINDKLGHLLAFVVLAFLADHAFPAFPDQGLDLKKALFLAGYGLLIELLQWPIPYRSFSMLDIVADVAGIALYALASPAVRNLVRAARGGGDR